MRCEVFPACFSCMTAIRSNTITIKNHNFCEQCVSKFDNCPQCNQSTYISCVCTCSIEQCDHANKQKCINCGLGKQVFCRATLENILSKRVCFLCKKCPSSIGGLLYNGAYICQKCKDSCICINCFQHSDDMYYDKRLCYDCDQGDNYTCWTCLRKCFNKLIGRNRNTHEIIYDP